MLLPNISTMSGDYATITTIHKIGKYCTYVFLFIETWRHAIHWMKKKTLIFQTGHALVNNKTIDHESYCVSVSQYNNEVNVDFLECSNRADEVEVGNILYPVGESSPVPSNFWIWIWLWLFEYTLFVLSSDADLGGIYHCHVYSLRNFTGIAEPV